MTTWYVVALGTACTDGTGRPPVLSADLPLHLEEHLDAATAVGSDAPADPPKVVEWRFDEPQPDWKVAVPLVRTFAPAQVERTADALRLTPSEGDTPATTPWRRLGLFFEARGPASVELLSVSVVPKGALYAGAPFGVRSVTTRDRIRRTLYTHVPGRLSYRVRMPDAGRLDVGLGVLGGDAPVTFRASVEARGRVEALFEERYADADEWAQRSVDLSAFAGRTVNLSLEANPEGRLAQDLLYGLRAHHAHAGIRSARPRRPLRPPSRAVPVVGRATIISVRGDRNRWRPRGACKHQRPGRPRAHG